MRWQNRAMRTLTIMALSVATLAGCASTSNEPDASAKLACRHFRNVSRDAADGILTDAELRTKLGEVERDARGSEEPGIAARARDLFAAFTSGTYDERMTSIEALGNACRAVGL